MNAVSLSAVACFALCASAALAQEPDQLRQCSRLENPETRLICYDALVATSESENNPSIETSPTSPPDVSDIGKWQVQNETDPLTDQATFLAVLVADEGSSGFQKPSLLIRCKGSVAEVFVSWSEYLADNIVVTARFGSAQPEVFGWEASTDQTATFLPILKMGWFFGGLAANERLVAKITPYRSGPITAIFDLRGINNALIGKERLCGLQ